MFLGKTINDNLAVTNHSLGPGIFFSRNAVAVPGPKFKSGVHPHLAYIACFGCGHCLKRLLEGRVDPHEVHRLTATVLKRHEHLTLQGNYTQVCLPQSGSGLYVVVIPIARYSPLLFGENVFVGLTTEDNVYIQSQYFYVHNVFRRLYQRTLFLYIIYHIYLFVKYF